jgi:hypothetical protein
MNKSGVYGENNVTESLWQTVSQKSVLSTPHILGTDCIGRSKLNYYTSRAMKILNLQLDRCSVSESVSW